MKMLSPAIESAAPMGQQFSMEDEGIGAAVAKGGNSCGPTKERTNACVPDRARSSDDGTTASGTADGGPCMKDKIDNLIENYLLGRDDNDASNDSDVEARSEEQKHNNSEISMKTLANEKCVAIDPPRSFVRKISEVVQAKSDSGLSVKSNNDTATAVNKEHPEIKAEEQPTKESKSMCEKVSPPSKGDIKTEEAGDSNKKKSLSVDSSQNSNVTTFQTLIEKVLNNSLPDLNKDHVGEKTNILDVSDHSIKRVKSPPPQINLADKEHYPSPPELGDSSAKTQQRQSSTVEDMSISKRKLVCLKDHIERVLEKSYNSSMKKDEKEMSDSSERSKNQMDESQFSESETKVENCQPNQGKSVDSNGFNAQEMVDTVIDQTKVVNKLLSPSKESSSKGEISEAEKTSTNQDQGHNHLAHSGPSAHSGLRRPSEIGPDTESKTGYSGTDNARHSEQMNKALMQGMERLQPHVQETVANLGRKMAERSSREGEWKDIQEPPHSYGPGYPQERHMRPHLPYPVDKSCMPYIPRPNHPFHSGPMSGGPMSGGPMSGAPMSGAPMSGGPMSGGPMSGAPMSVGPGLPNRPPKEMMPSSPQYPNNSHYPYSGMMHSPSLPRQLSPRQPIPQQPSPRQPSPSAPSQVPNKLSPDSRQMYGHSSHHATHREGGHHLGLPQSSRESANHIGHPMLRDHVSHHAPVSLRDNTTHVSGHPLMSGSHNHHPHHHHGANGHQISLRDCQCTSCDLQPVRKPDQKDGYPPLSAEYASLKPGHISSGSPYHSQAASMRPPMADHQMSPHVAKPQDKNGNPKISSAMALGPTPPLTYYQSQQHQQQQQHPFKMPQLYPSNPPISSPREYSRMMAQHSPGAMPQQVSPQGGSPSMWKASERELKQQLPPSVAGQFSPMPQQKIQQQTSPLPYPPAQHPHPYHPHQLPPHHKRDGPNRGDNSWGKEPGEIQSHDNHYGPHGEPPSKPKEVTPVLDLSVKKKEEVKPTGDQPLDLTCKTQKSPSVYDDNQESRERERGSLRTSVPYSAANDTKFNSPSRNTFLHQLESSVQRLIRERKPPGRGSEGGSYPPQPSPHSVEHLSPKRAFPQQVRGLEQAPNPSYTANSHPDHSPHHRDRAYPMTVAPNASKLPPPLMPAIYAQGPYQGSSQSPRAPELSPRGHHVSQQPETGTSSSQLHGGPQQSSQNFQHLHQSKSQHYPMQGGAPSRHQPHPSHPPHPNVSHLSNPTQQTPYSQQSPYSQPNHHNPQHSSPNLQQQQHQSSVSQAQPSEPPYVQPNRQETASPNDEQSRQGSKRSNVSKHEPIQNIIGNHSPNDILYLICRLCGQTYGSPYGFRKHFRNQHGFEPRAEHTIVQTISATKRTMNAPPQVGPYNIQQQAASPQQVPPRHPMEPASVAPVPPRPPAIFVTGPHSQNTAIQPSSQNAPFETGNANYKSSRMSFRDSNSSSSEPGNDNPSPHNNNVKPIEVKDNLQSSDQNTSKIESGQGSESSRDNIKNDSSQSPTECKRMECPECGQTFQLNDFGLFKRHCRQHGQPKIPQPLCPANEAQVSFSDQVSSSRDLSSSSGEAGADMNTVCKFCNIPFATSSFLQDHISNVHPDKTKTQQDNNSSHSDGQDTIQIKSSTPSVVQKVAAESATMSVSPDSSCEPQSIQDAKVSESYEDRQMPVLKKQVSTNSSIENDTKNNSDITDTKMHNSNITKSPESSTERQISSESGSLLDNSDEKSCDYSMDNVSYMHKKFSSHRNKRKHNVSSADTTTTNKQLKLSSDFVSSAKSPGSVNSPSAYSSNSYDSETSNMMEISSNEVGESDIGSEMDGTDDKHSKMMVKLKCDGIKNRAEARHQLPFVWDRVTRSQAGKNIRRNELH
ncbi:filaggrin-like isoform X4 [Argopecten irradians]|uniref:filaggrin-like isoform X4 n=1 Tax=Argopecten irradians TaxID=31199 RepID=UPI00371F9DFB